MGSHPWPGYLRRVAPLMGALAGMIPWGKIAALVGAMLVGGFLMHKLDKGVIEHKNVEIAQLKLDHQKAVNDALVWATEKQKDYDHAAIQAAQTDATRQQQLASDASDRARALASVPPRVLVRGCITYEFVRQLDAAIKSSGAASTLPLPAGKSADACAPVDAVAVVRWLLGIVEIAQANGQQLNDLIAFFRSAQALR
jgi:hypothetical protein